MKTVSIIIPVYNNQNTIKECLKSIYALNYSDFNVVVVNDKSTDKSRLFVSEFPCKIVDLKSNSGAGAARNRGAENADGEILVFTDADCILPQDWLTGIVKHFDDDKVGAVGGGYKFSAGESFIEKYAFNELLYRRKRYLKNIDAAFSNNLACRKNVFKELGGFPEYFKGAGMEEIVFTFALSRKYKIVWDKENGVGHNFNKTIIKYLKQQFIFAYRTLIVRIFIPPIASIELYKQRNEIYSFITFCLSQLFLVNGLINGGISYYLTGVSILIISYLLNLDYFLFLEEKESLKMVYRSFWYIYLRNLVWSAGFALGVLVGLLRKSSDAKKLWIYNIKI